MSHSKQSPVFDQASGLLLSESGIDTQQLTSVLSSAMTRQVDAADLYLQHFVEEAWSMEDGIVQEGDFSIERGFGLRVISGERIGFAYADDISLPALRSAVTSAKHIVQVGQSGELALSQHATPQALYPACNPLQSLADSDKVAMLNQLNTQLRQKDPRVCDVILRLSGSYDVVLVMQSTGEWAADVRPLVQLTMRVIVEQGGKRESAMAGGGARDSYAYFTDARLESYTDKVVAQALLNLEARPAPAGSMPVVLGPGWPAVLLHEAVGHGLEGDFNRKGSSAFSGRLGDRVATPLCTVVDDGTIAGRRGSLSIDDEGTTTQCTTLIDQGVLAGYMQDRLNAKLMNATPTGNGRRESYACQPIPRMTNTYMLPGESDPQEIIGSVKRGLYAVDFSGGQVDITSGKFVFTTSEAYLIEDGKLSYPVKAATLIGDGPAVLTKVSMVGNDLELDGGIGVCGKDGQTVPVGVGQPTIKVDDITVGGVA